MHTQPIDHRFLLEHVLPVDRLPVALRVRVHEALRQDDRHELQAAARDSLRALEAQGLVRPAAAGGGGPAAARRYHNLLTGELITLAPEAPRGDAVLAVPRPILPGGAPASLDTLRELVGLATRILTEDGHRVAGSEQIIELLTGYGCQVLDCLSVRFLTAEAQGDAETVADSDSPFAQAVLGGWGARRQQLYVVHDLGPAGDGGAGGGGAAGGRDFRSAAAVRLGEPGDAVQGLLEARSARPHHFNRERLALLELLAETGRELLTNSARLQKLVFVDARTQIFNKSFFDIQLDHFLARTRREGRQMALAIADIDDFKGFNSRFGYQGGDQVLHRVAQILKASVRPFDCVARWGGEEFGILLAPPVELEDARSICERLRLAVQRTSLVVSDLEGREHRTGVTVSIGGSLFPHDGQTAAALWRRANEALLEAKADGKNLVRFRRQGPGGPPAGTA